MIFRSHVGIISSDSFSMLPSKPKIFHGRDSELHEIVSTLYQDSARVAILGAGGMGKTSLARAVLHHPGIISKYEQRVFVGCDSARTGIDIAAQIGMHLGLKADKDLTKCVVKYFSQTSIGPTLLTLDNLDTPWEPKESRGAVEELISLLTEIPHLALMVRVYDSVFRSLDTH
jgi:ABC-type branched-subunit amino acid transport system ATPase component